MELLKRILPYIGIIVGLLGILLNISFSNYKSCDFANSNTDYIRKQVQLALDSKDKEMVKYFVFKGIRGIEKAAHNFDDCGCLQAKRKIEKAHADLKNAVISNSLEKAKISIAEALEHIESSLRALNDYQNNKVPNSSLMSMETNPFKSLEVEDPELIDRMNKNLEHYQNSLDKVVETVDCQEAKAFFQQIIETTEKELDKSHLDKALRFYQSGVKQLTKQALESLNECN